MHLTCPTHTRHIPISFNSSWFHDPSNIFQWAYTAKNLFVKSSSSTSVISYLLGPSNILSTLFSNTSTYALLEFEEQTLNTYKKQHGIQRDFQRLMVQYLVKHVECLKQAEGLLSCWQKFHKGILFRGIWIKFTQPHIFLRSLFVLCFHLRLGILIFYQHVTISLLIPFNRPDGSSMEEKPFSKKYFFFSRNI